MIPANRYIRLAFWLLAAGGLLATQARAQSVWLTGTIGPGSTNSATPPPALVFDSQDRPHVVFATGDPYLQHIAGDNPGVIPAWSPAVSTTVSVSSGQIYLARAGSQFYLGLRPATPEYTPRTAVFDGTSWQPYAPSWYGEDYYYSKGYRHLYGLVIDSGGQPYWLTNSEQATDRYTSSNDPTIPAWGYFLIHHTAPDTAIVTPLALGTGGGTSPGTSAERSIYQGGQAVLDRFGNLHTIQYYNRGGGLLLYARGPLAGPFQVSDNFDAGWQVKMGRPTLTVDPTGAPHVVYAVQWPVYGLKHLAWTGTSWTSEWIERGGSAAGYLGTFPKILVDRLGRLHVIYADPMHGVLKHAVKSQDIWQIDTIDQVGTQAYNIAAPGMLAAAVDSQGGIGVVYWDAANLVLKYAYRLPLDQTFDPVSSAAEGINQ